MSKIQSFAMLVLMLSVTNAWGVGFLDNFNRADGDVGNDWVTRTDGTIEVKIVDNEVLIAGEQGTDWVRCGISRPVEDETRISFDFKADDSFNVHIRINDVTTSAYIDAYSWPGGPLQYASSEDGSWPGWVAMGGSNMLAGEYNTLVLEQKGTEFTYILNGEVIGPVTNSNLTKIGRVLIDSDSAAGTTGSLHIDNVMIGIVFAEKAKNPSPENGAIHPDTWVNLSWTPGDFAVSHDVYLGDNLDDVNEATRDSELFRGNQDLMFYTAGFPGYAYPDGLVNGTTYYWRIDEVNDDNPSSPWKGEVWSFLVPPKTAYGPDPADGAELVNLSTRLRWTAGYGAILSTVYFGEDFDTVNNASGGPVQGTTTYNPGTLKLAKTYYWRVDAFDGTETHKGEVWSFTTQGAVSSPNPANGALGVNPLVVLGWNAGAVAASHEVYFGTDADAVANATTVSPEYKGPKALGEESYDPGKLLLGTTYYWRIDEVNSVNPDSPWAGKVWSFTTSDFFVIDDFEGYDAAENQIWFFWHDGLGYGTPGTADYYAGNGSGAAVGDENTLSYTEETIVHGGLQSMPIAYDNNKQGYSKYSEVELTLTDQRDWTAEGVAELSLWFRGNPASVGSFIEAPTGTYTMTAAGADIWNDADEFHFAFKTLAGVGTIEAQVLSVDNTDQWAKAGVMIRETLDPGSKFAAVYITPGNGCRFQARMDTGIDATSDTSVVTTEQTAITAPYWVKIERDISGNFRGYYSANGSSWQQMSWNPQNISMNSNVYVGLALTSHNSNAICNAGFSNVTITGSVTGQWMNQDIGIESNDAEPLYVALSNTAGTPAVVYHDDPAAANIETWSEWIIPLQTFAGQGINLKNVDRIAIGLGTHGNMAVPGGSGKMYIDDIRLYQSREASE